jgi:predicted metal-dependent phosphotriesterase family hydrolase
MGYQTTFPIDARSQHHDVLDEFTLISNAKNKVKNMQKNQVRNTVDLSPVGVGRNTVNRLASQEGS